MKKIGTAFAVLATLLLSCGGARAQKFAPKSAPATIAPDLTKLNIEKILQQAQTTKVQPSTQDISSLQVVAEFLQLRPGQVGELEQLLQARQAALVPLFQTEQPLIQQLAGTRIDARGFGGCPPQRKIENRSTRASSNAGWQRPRKRFVVRSVQELRRLLD